jgi:hypothetical protein
MIVIGVVVFLYCVMFGAMSISILVAEDLDHSSSPR